MSTDKLARVIDEAFEGRDKMGRRPKARCARRSIPRSNSWIRRASAVAERDANGQWHVNQWLKKAVLLSFRLNDMNVILGGPGKAAWWDKVISNSRVGAARIPQGRFSRGAGLCGPPLGVHRARRRTDAVLCQSRRLRRFRYHGRHLGHGRQLRADRQELPYFRWRRHRRRAGPLQAGPVIIEDNCFVGARSEVAEGVIVRTGAVLSMASIWAPRRDRRSRDRRGYAGRSAGLFCCRAWYVTGQERRSRPLLRRDRQARGRTHALQDKHQ